MKLSIKQQLFTTIGLLSVFLFFTAIIHGIIPAYKNYLKNQYLDKANHLSDQIIIEAKHHAIERGITNALISSYMNNQQIRTDFLASIKQSREAGDNAIEKAFSIGEELLLSEFASESFIKYFILFKQNYQKLQQVRKQVDGLANGSSIQSDNWLKVMTAVIRSGALVRQYALVQKNEALLNIVKDIKQSTWRASEYAGIERAIIGQIISSGMVFTAEQLQELIKNRTIVELALAKLDNNIKQLQLYRELMIPIKRWNVYS